ncbi:MAG: tetratricopeptide repeat protein, partial [Acidobacteriota bacterium]|nr:tetratricopeptide repeat protein [Acidobacteriota bacterium]
MTGREFLVLGVAAACSLSVMGWIIWSERPVPAPPPPEPAAAAEPAPEPEALEVDAERVAELEASAEASPDDASVRVSLGDLYFDARQFETAISWYEEAMAVDPAHVDASTSLAMSWFHAGDTS